LHRSKVLGVISHIDWYNQKDAGIAASEKGKKEQKAVQNKTREFRQNTQTKKTR